MSPDVVAALVAAQTPDHVSCRAQELVDYDGIDSTIVVQCSCNVRLTLTVPRTPEPVEALKSSGMKWGASAPKADPDVS